LVRNYLQKVCIQIHSQANNKNTDKKLSPTTTETKPKGNKKKYRTERAENHFSKLNMP